MSNNEFKTNHNSIDEALERNLQDMQRLANIYYQRGDYERAREIKRALDEVREQMEKTRILALKVPPAPVAHPQAS